MSEKWPELEESEQERQEKLYAADFLAEVERRAGATRDVMLKHVELDARREGDCDLKRWLIRILGGAK